MSGYSLRPCTAGDEAFARRLHREAYEDVVTRQFGCWDEARQRSLFDAKWDPARFQVVVADSQPVGLLAIERRDDEVFGAVRKYGLLERTSISTMEVSTVKRLGTLKEEQGIETGLSLGWTVPKVTRDWLGMPKMIRPALAMGLASVRVRMPGQVRRGLSEFEVDSVWAFFGVVTPRLVETIHDADKKLNVWTVDDPARIEALRELGVDGICSNDPRILQ